MKQLTLSIKQKNFDLIKEGVKKDEHREIRPNNAKRYCDFKETGELIGPREYDTIKFLTGAYEGKRPEMVVEVLSSEIVYFVDEETNEVITYEENGEEYIEAEIIYQLGDIISQ